MPTRRDVLRSLGCAGGLTIAGARPSAAQAAAFGGARAGEAREIEGVRFCWCPPGRFTMGSPASEPGHRPDEAPVEVTLSRGFWMAAFETTQGQWRRIVGAFPGTPPSEAFGLGDDVPVYWVNYAAAEAFSAALTQRARRAAAIPASAACRLPTEAQWEYACRAGTTTATAFGETLSRTQANFDEAARYGAARPAAGSVTSGRAMPVGSYPANAWGLYDMHGNIFEWCRDWYQARLPGGVDPDVQVQGGPNRDGSYSRVRRGGAWNDAASFCRSALRLRYELERDSDHIGFRVALVDA
jgi:formylglycine-generating enzyme required for sulfatase activity